MHTKFSTVVMVTDQKKEWYQKVRVLRYCEIISKFSISGFYKLRLGDQEILCIMVTDKKTEWYRKVHVLNLVLPVLVNLVYPTPVFLAENL
eukprot:SAG11_NODE_6745_length_1255_cov_1.565744_2_plen_91_part_00